MSSPKSIARQTGVLLLLHLAAGLTVPFIMLHPLIAPADFLVTGAANANQVRAAVLIFFAGSAFAIGVAIAALRVFRQYSSPMAFWLVAVAVAYFSLQSVDNGALLSMVSLSQEYARAGAARADTFQALAVVVGSARRWTHYSALLVVGGWIFLLYSLLFRFALVPRMLAACGLIASALQITAVSLRGIFGYSPITVLAIPLAPIHITLGVWLIVKGFEEGRRPIPTAGPPGY